MKKLKFSVGDAVTAEVRLVQTVYIAVFLGMAALGCVWVLSGYVLGPVGEVNPLLQVIAMAVLLAVLSFVAGVLTGDYSWTDRLWSTAPVAMAWVYAAAAQWDIRLVATALLVTLWGLRLSFNFARRGGYSGMEDYRWAILRDWIGHRVLWQGFNLVFIAGYQHALFVGFTLPLYVMYRHAGQPLSLEFWVGAGLMLGFLLIETIADQQQWNFQNRKAAARAAGEAEHSGDADIRHGFLTRGLFHRSRHPNYLGELGVWWSVYLIGAVTADSLLHWSIIGPVLLTLLFMGSTWFTERITASRYPEYREYQRRTWAIFPRPY